MKKINVINEGVAVFFDEIENIIDIKDLKKISEDLTELEKENCWLVEVEPLKIDVENFITNIVENVCDFGKHNKNNHKNNTEHYLSLFEEKELNELEQIINKMFNKLYFSEIKYIEKIIF